MPTQENDETPLPTPMESNGSSLKTSLRQKRKGVAMESTMEKIFANFHSFIEMVGPEFKMLAKVVTRNTKSVA